MKMVTYQELMGELHQCPYRKNCEYEVNMCEEDTHEFFLCVYFKRRVKKDIIEQVKRTQKNISLTERLD